MIEWLERDTLEFVPIEFLSIDFPVVDDRCAGRQTIARLTKWSGVFIFQTLDYILTVKLLLGFSIAIITTCATNSCAIMPWNWYLDTWIIY